MKKGYLVLENGRIFEGKAFGADAPRIGELVFETGMVGYVEAITDPSFYGQIVLQTFPSAGNYGVCEEDFEGKPALFGFVVRDVTPVPSNYRSQYELDTIMKKIGVMGICGIDTRAVTRILRENGSMNAMICTEIPEDLAPIREYRITKAVQHVTCEKEYTVEAQGEEKHRVTMIDYGAKKSIAENLAKRGCRVRVVPADTSAEEILKDDPDGIMLSNGPGDPLENPGEIEQVRKLFGKKPMFGICLGYQILAVANGGRVEKMKFGHHGGNQPVTSADRSRTYITSQNHIYAVVGESVEGAKVRYFNANDGSCEGIEFPGKKTFAVQFHPEAHSGPRDTGFLFDEFVAMMEE